MSYLVFQQNNLRTKSSVEQLAERCRVRPGMEKGTGWMCSTDWTDSKRNMSLKVTRKCLCHLFYPSVRLISKGCYCLGNLQGCSSTKALKFEAVQAILGAFWLEKKEQETAQKWKPCCQRQILWNLFKKCEKLHKKHSNASLKLAEAYLNRKDGKYSRQWMATHSTHRAAANVLRRAHFALISSGKLTGMSLEMIVSHTERLTPDRLRYLTSTSHEDLIKHSQKIFFFSCFW